MNNGKVRKSKKKYANDRKKQKKIAISCLQKINGLLLHAF